LVEQFEALKKKNNEIDEIARLTSKEMSVDPEYIEMLNKRVQEDLEETRMELKWDAEYSKLRLHKLQNYVKDELEVDTFAIKAIRQLNYVISTFKVKKMSEYLRQNLDEIKRTIDKY
jgi:hypothetical protein